MTDIDSRPRFRKLSPHASGVEDKRGREVYCDYHPGVRATWTGEWRPVSRIMFYPFNLCAECFDRARKGEPWGVGTGERSQVSTFFTSTHPTNTRATISVGRKTSTRGWGLTCAGRGLGWSRWQ